MSNPRYWLIVPAAGKGRRMQSDCPKQYLRLDDRYILDITLSRLLSGGIFHGCMVALGEGDDTWPDTLASGDPRVRTCAGGRERADSVLAALAALKDDVAPDDWVLVHDAARPCLDPSDLANLTATLRHHPVGGLLAAPVADTLKQSVSGTAPDAPEVQQTADRSRLWRALTPQMFRYNLLLASLEKALREGLPVTDEASALEQAGYRPRLVEGRPDNIKVTVPADLELAGFILSRLEQTVKP